MKLSTIFYVTLIGAFSYCLYTGVVSSAQENGVPKKGAAAHASLSAYPQAVISLKEPKTGMVFYVESNGRRLVAIDNDGVVVWSVDVLDEAKIKPTRGMPVIRHLRLQAGELRATCGKSYEAKIDIKTGKAEFAGAD